uniref:Uncharacterized protein AlNc14C28G2724 n=1 Tax=Albugo laibachii Nc14 TaxID=890382 RepID=F0W7A2_9STRA|nr:conserved hypothetical protein [Albugo laibachii Nc14]|eukprot:CCA17001.1 conserved hypothetical protein [Albugo laibachii Nc14]
MTHLEVNSKGKACSLLVPYCALNPFHDGLRDAKRVIQVGSHSIEIAQRWKNDGKGGTALGFGASVYDAAIVLALYLAHNPDYVRNKNVLELGCGTGFLSIAAARLGASFVLATDGDRESVQLAAENTSHNLILSDTCKSVEFLWGSDPNAILLESPSKCWDVILGADIVACPYASSLSALVQSLHQLCQQDTIVLLAYKKRNVVEERFFKVLREFFDVEMIDLGSVVTNCYDGNIKLFRAVLRANPGM